MVKPLLLLAFMANAFIWTTNAGKVHSAVQSVSQSSSHSSSVSEFHSSSSSVASGQIASTGQCKDGKKYQQVASAASSASSSTLKSSSSSSSSSSSFASSVGLVEHPDCHSCCQNEIWVECPDTVCAPKTCDEVGFPVPCIDLPPDGKCPSKPGCICEEAFVRNKKGICVPMYQCPECGGDPNAVSGCGTNCNRLCSNYNKKNVSCIQGCFYNACECKKGHVFDEVTRKCVIPSNCTPPKKCQKNAVYDLCPADCPARTCGINDALVRCARPLPPGHPDCRPPKCRCKDGFYMDAAGNCVRWEDCPKCNRPNEIYKPCPAPCPPQRCDVNEALILCLVPPQLGDPECEPGCVCIDGFVRDYTGICIPKEQCPKCSEPNQVFDPCIAPCPPRRCDVNPLVIKCAPPPKLGDPTCEAGCRCADGYLANHEGVCIPEEDCPKCTKPHEIFVPCPVLCPPQTCESIGKKYHCPFQITHKGRIEERDGIEIVHPCDAQCMCEDGYFRNKRGECISKENCLKCRGLHEYFSCGPVCDNECARPDWNQTDCPIKNIVCTEKCYCEAGYARDAYNNCIPIKDCRVPHCGVNERYEQCPQSNCELENCNQLGFPIQCPAIAVTDSYGCAGKPKCVCIEGHVRNKNGVCIPKNKCPKCAGDPNKVAGCGVYCNQRCRNVGQTEPEACILICYDNACDCVDGYFLDENTGKCVPSHECTPQCSENEQYSECIQSICDAQHCSQLGYPIPCPRIDPKYCKKGCICKNGYVRNEHGICIPKLDCPKCGGDPNAQSGCGTNCNKRCSDIGNENAVCILSCILNGCDCRDGFYFDKNIGLCVEEDQCTQQCSDKERYSECVQGDCSPQKCSQLGFPIACPSVDPDYCEPGCLCIEGYVRNKYGVCMPASNCSSCAGDSNKVPGCGVYCNQRCRNVGQEEPESCIAICYSNACDCRKGTVLDENTGKCVPAHECTPQCRENEQYSECIQGNCSPQNCSQLGFSVPCPRIDPKYCKKGCICKEGFVRRDEDGVCIPKIDCPSCAGDTNKVAGCGIYCNQRCKNLEQDEEEACILLCHENSCDCRPGYYLDENSGFCVEPGECTPQCCKNEWYSDCIQGQCSPQTCSELGFPIPCPDILPEFCEEGCLCKPGYVRNYHGDCMPAIDCPSCRGDPNAQAGCGGYCNRRCSDIGKEPRLCILLCELNGCDCKENYWYDENTGKCVCSDDCSPVCGVNEEFSNCTNAYCAPRHCDDLGFPLDCEDTPPGGCIEGCLCIPGYLRNKYGVCIPAEDCPSCGGDSNAMSGCGTYCNKRCTDVGKEPHSCPIACVRNGCDCKKDFYFDAYIGKCVKAEHCTNKCGRNEIYENCSDPSCRPQTCSELGFPLDCDEECVKRCICKPGYARDEYGSCIPYEECPSCGGDPNAVTGCGVNCGQRCSDIGRKGPVACPAICKLNGCDCRKGFYFHGQLGKCVRRDQCPPICSENNNEVYSECINGGCTARNCSQYGQPVPCIKMDPKYCIKGCVCKEGYLRTINGQCIPAKHCPEACNGPNEEYKECTFNCPPQTCESLDRAYACPIIDGNDCQPMCGCKAGFFRSKTGLCITEEQCRMCTDPNEHFDCGSACDRECGKLNEICPIVNIRCNERCYCDDNYARARNGTCIPISCCDEPQCSKNEKHVECPSATCEPQYCTQLGRPIKCPPVKGKCPVKPGCICVEGYVRNKDGSKCIPKKDCPSCGGDKNAESGCGVNCGKRCRDLGREPGPCIEICYPNACDCKDTFYFDAIQRKCVLPGNCTDICDENEHFENCSSNPICKAHYCSQLGFPLDCDTECRKGCVCDDGFIRDDDTGICIPVCECPSCGGDPNAESGCGINCMKTCYDLQNPKRPRPCPKICRVNACDCRENHYFDDNTGKCVLAKKCTPQCGKNEVYTPYANAGCDRRNCSQLGEPRLCIDPIEFKGGCVCKKDYLRLNNGTCVPIDECPKPRCRKNERFEICPAKTCQPQSCDEIGFPIDCPEPDAECTDEPACICDYGHVRNNKGICRPKEECPMCRGDPNQKSGCGIYCGSRCPNNYLNQKLCPRICLPNACDCKPGFLFDINTKTCVEPEECSPRCEELNNEEYDPCINGGCGWKNCSEVGGPVVCKLVTECFKGCKCKEGYYRDNEGKCVPENECTLTCSKPNEVYDPCPSNCPPQTCESIGHMFFCPRRNKNDCKGACRCKPSFYRNMIGECICADDCLKCTGPNEYFSCGPSCDNVCSKLDKETKDNCIEKNIKCVERCYCIDGYARNSTGICIPIDQCPGHGKPSPSVNATEVIAKFIIRNQDMASELLYVIQRLRSGENFMVSGYSIMLAVAQLTLRSIKETRTQMLNFLGLGSNEEIETVYPILINEYSNQRNVTFNVGVKTYASDIAPLNPEFVEQIKEVFNAQIESLDFRQNVEAAAIINKWVEDGTNGLITELVSPDMFNEDTRCVITNYIYFLGNWIEQFKEDNTQPREFYVDEDNTITLPTMYQEAKMQYGESDELDCQIVKKDYKGGNFSFIAYLPRKRTGLPTMLEKMRVKGAISRSLSRLERETVRLQIPKFDISSTYDLTDILKKLNLTEPFKQNSDGFDGILLSNEPIYISDAIQKTRMKFDEKGTEAAAATAVILMTRSLQRPPTEIFNFIANHPFAYAISFGDMFIFVGCFQN